MKVLTAVVRSLALLVPFAAYVYSLPLAQAQDSTVIFSASAFGTQAFVGNTVLSGKTAFVILAPCSTQVGANRTNSTTGVNAPPLFTSGTVTSNASTSADASAASNDVQNVSALGGLITADEVKAVSSTSDINGNLQSSASGSTFTNLVVAGQKIQGTPAPNTKIDLAGFGYVVLNERSSKTGESSSSLTVNMIHVYIKQENALNIPDGAQVIVADASSGIQLAENSALDGNAYGTRVNVANTIESGPTALEIMPCLGTDDTLKENTTTGVNITGVLSSGTVTDTAQGAVTQASSNGETTSTVQGLNVLSSLVTADVIEAVAQGDTTSNGTFQFSHEGSKFANLKVAGHSAINDSVAPNTHVHIAGLGTLWLYRVTTTANSLSVTMIELIVDQTNAFNLPVGTDVRVSVANISLGSN
jgi:hypothetical protein